MADILECVLLLALPASGKSEVRRYLAGLTEKQCRDEFHMGPTVQLDDFPYVHMMRRIDDELAAMGESRIFFQSPERPFRSPYDWGTLIQLINQDHRDLLARKVQDPPSAAELLLDRIDRAGGAAGIDPRLSALSASTRRVLSDRLEAEAREMLEEKQRGYPDSLAGKTLVIEFARGGPQGSSFPLPDGYGYRYSLGQLSEEILSRAVILYVWVTPEESRRKNQERADPDDPGSILHHGVPIEVMLGDYGCDDLDWLEANSARPGTVTVEAHGRTFHLPLGRFDNRVDKTSFIRKDRAEWTPEEVRAVHEGLKQALDRIASLR